MKKNCFLLLFPLTTILSSGCAVQPIKAQKPKAEAEVIVYKNGNVSTGCDVTISISNLTKVTSLGVNASMVFFDREGVMSGDARINPDKTLLPNYKLSISHIVPEQCEKIVNLKLNYLSFPTTSGNLMPENVFTRVQFSNKYPMK